MRKLLSILLLAIVGLTVATPLFAATPAEATLRACCRRHGAHRCSGNMDGMDGMSVSARNALAQETPEVSAPAAPCPFCPATPAVAHPAAFVPTLMGITQITLQTHPTGVPQTESRLRIAESRSRHKRGPPAIA